MRAAFSLSSSSPSPLPSLWVAAVAVVDVDVVADGGETAESVWERVRPGDLGVLVVVVVVGVEGDDEGGMESIRSWALARVEVKRLVRAAAPSSSLLLPVVCGAMSVFQERGPRDLKGRWWDMFVCLFGCLSPSGISVPLFGFLFHANTQPG
jgi:hypothetical protein